MSSQYQSGIPTGTVNLNQDYRNIQQNFQQLDTSFGVDHLPFSNNTAQNGYHTTMHMVPATTTPAAVAAIGELFCKTLNDGSNTDQVLYYQTGGVVGTDSRLIQLTRNFVPSAAQTGYTFLPGGLIMKWGFVDFGSSSIPASGTVTFSITAPTPAFTNCFNVQITLFASTTPNSISSISLRSVAAAGFNYNYLGSANNTAFYWQAIGK